MYKKLIAVGLSCSLFAVPTLTSATGNSTIKNNDKMNDSFTIEMEGKDYNFKRYETNDTRVIEVQEGEGKEIHTVSLNSKTNELKIDGDVLSVEESSGLNTLSSQLVNSSSTNQAKVNIGTNAVVYPGGPGSSWSHRKSFTVSFQAFSYAPTVLAALLLYANLDSKSVKNKAATLVVITGVLAGQASKVTFKTTVYSKIVDLDPYTDSQIHKFFINTYSSSGNFIRGIEFQTL